MARATKAQIISLQKKLKTDIKIGEKFGITRQAIFQLRKKYGIPSVMAENKERNEKIVKAYESGMSGTKIAKKFRLAISHTYRIINAGQKGKKRGRGNVAIGTWPTPEKPRPKKKVVKKRVVKKKVVKKKKK